MTAMLIGSLCTGFGGLDMAAQAVLAAELAWAADPDTGAAAILAHHHPTVPNLGDITTVDWAAAAPVDVLTAGFPCQDVSVAGVRAGLAPGTRSGLWAHIARAIAQIRPRLVVIENVPGLLHAPADRGLGPGGTSLADAEPGPLRALGAVLGDLAALGFDAEWASVRASDVGAPHRRERLFLLAWPADAPREGLEARGQGRVGGVAVVDAACDGRQQGRPQPAREQWGSDVAERGGAPAADWGAYAPAIRRWERILGRPAPPPTEPTGRRRAERLSPAFVEWLMGLPDGHVTAVPGLTRTQQLHALGNGVVPQQGAMALRALLDRASATA